MLLRQIVDDKLAQYAFLIGCQQTGEAIVIDPERDVDRYLAHAAHEGLRLVAAAETHIHADFLSGTRELAARVPGLRVYLSGETTGGGAYTWPDADDSNVTRLRNHDLVRIGRIELRAWHTPGHTAEHLAFVVTDGGAHATVPIGVLTGDFLFVNDLGRPDLLETAVGVRGDMQRAARQLHESARQLGTFEDFVQVWPGHGAGSACGKALGAIPMSTIGYERRLSPALAAAAGSESAFVDFILADQPEPPLYFARMKALNQSGPPILGALPEPRRLEAVNLDAATQIVDARRNRQAFLSAHFRGAFHAPLDRMFPAFVGSLVDPDRPITLILEEGSDVEEAVRSLVRIGFDGILGWVPFEALVSSGLLLEHIESIGLMEYERRRQHAPMATLDVRSAAEYRARHIPGAINIPYTRLRVRSSEVPNGPPLHVHCGSGARAAAAAAYLSGLGRSVVHVDGSFSTWKPEDHRTE